MIIQPFLAQIMQLADILENRHNGLQRQKNQTDYQHRNQRNFK